VSERVNSIDRAKCYTMILVVIGHVLLVSPFNIQLFPTLFKITSIIYSFHMSLFFVVSGFLLFLSTEKYRNKIGIFYKNQLYRVFYPIFTSIVAYNILIYIFLAFFGNMLWRTAIEWWNPLPVLIIGGTWFLFALFIFNCTGFLIFGILLKDKRSILSFVIYVTILIIGYFLLSVIIFKEYFPFIFGISEYIFWFFIGGFAIPVITLFYQALFHNIRYYLLFLLVYGLIYYNIFLVSWALPFIFPITTLFLIFFLSHLEVPKIDNFVIKIGQLSIQMFILQFFVIDFVWQSVYRIFLMNFSFMTGVMYYVIAIIFVYLCTMVFVLVIKNSFLNVLLFGQK